MSTYQPRMSIIAVAWTILIALSLLPTVIAQEVLGQPVSADLRAGCSVVLIAAVLGASVIWTPLRALRGFLWVFFVLLGMQWLVFSQPDRLPILRTWLDDPSFGVRLLTEVGLNLVVTLAMIAVLLAMKRDRHSFYLAKGDSPPGPNPSPGWA